MNGKRPVKDAYQSFVDSVDFANIRNFLGKEVPVDDWHSTAFKSKFQKIYEYAYENSSTEEEANKKVADFFLGEKWRRGSVYVRTNPIEAFKEAYPPRPSDTSVETTDTSTADENAAREEAIAKTKASVASAGGKGIEIVPDKSLNGVVDSLRRAQRIEELTNTTIGDKPKMVKKALEAMAKNGMTSELMECRQAAVDIQDIYNRLSEEGRKALLTGNGRSVKDIDKELRAVKVHLDYSTPVLEIGNGFWQNIVNRFDGGKGGKSRYAVKDESQLISTHDKLFKKRGNLKSDEPSVLCKTMNSIVEAYDKEMEWYEGLSDTPMNAPYITRSERRLGDYETVWNEACNILIQKMANPATAEDTIMSFKSTPPWSLDEVAGTIDDKNVSWREFADMLLDSLNKWRFKNPEQYQRLMNEAARAQNKMTGVDMNKNSIPSNSTSSNGNTDQSSGEKYKKIATAGENKEEEE